MSAEQAFTRTWKVGEYRATLSCPKPKPGQALAAVIEWEPAQPARLSPHLLAVYRAGRDAALADLSRELRITVAVLEV